MQKFTYLITHICNLGNKKRWK